MTSLGSMNIRDYEADDKPALEELTLRAWEPVFADLERSIKPEIYEVFVPDWQAEQMRSLNTVCDSGDIHTIVAERDGKILGFAAMSFHPEDFLGQIFMIGVDPDYQRRGVGTALINAGIGIIKQRGFALVMIETGGDPGHAAARKTYEKMGFDLYPVARYLKRV
ncbi:MAG: GNAT family N-acetyltransferase [Pseudohongiellaceae bacterium]